MEKKTNMNKKGTDNNNIKIKLYKDNIFDKKTINNNKDNNKTRNGLIVETDIKNNNMTHNDLMVETDIKNNENNEIYLSKKSNNVNENYNININKVVSFNEIGNNINIVDKRDSPKDNNRNRAKNVIKNIEIKNYEKSNIKPSVIIQNVINKNSINNISINSINANNIIIINNTIFARNNKLPKEKKKEIIRKEKVPEDEKIPKDNHKKKSVLLISMSQIAKKKFPLDNAKRCSPEHIKPLMKETFPNDETKYHSKTIKIDKYRKDDFYRNYSNVENRLNKNLNNIRNYNLKTEINNKIIKKRNENDNSLYRKNEKNTFINKYNNKNSNMNDKFVTYTYRSKHNLINKFDNKNNFVNKNNNKSRIDLSNKTFHLIKSKSTNQNEKYPKITKQNSMIYKKIDKKKNIDEDSCMLF